MSVQNAILLLNATSNVLKSITQNSGVTQNTGQNVQNAPSTRGREFVSERSQFTQPLYQAIRATNKVIREQGGPPTPEQLDTINKLEAEIKAVLSRFGKQASGHAYKDSWKFAAKDVSQDFEIVMDTIGEFLHASSAQSAEAFREVLAGTDTEKGVAKQAEENAKVIERKVNKAEQGDLKELQWFYDVFNRGADLRIKDNCSIVDENGNKKKVESAKDLLELKEQNPKQYKALFERARKGATSWKRPGQSYDSISGDITVPDLVDKQDARELYRRGKSVQDFDQMAYPRNSRSQNKLTVKNRKTH